MEFTIFQWNKKQERMIFYGILCFLLAFAFLSHLTALEDAVVSDQTDYESILHSGELPSWSPVAREPRTDSAALEACPRLRSGKPKERRRDSSSVYLNINLSTIYVSIHPSPEIDSRLSSVRTQRTFLWRV